MEDLMSNIKHQQNLMKELEKSFSLMQAKRAFLPSSEVDGKNFHLKPITEFSPLECIAAFNDTLVNKKKEFRQKYAMFKTEINKLIDFDSNFEILDIILLKIRRNFIGSFSEFFHHTIDVLRDFTLLFDYNKILEYPVLEGVYLKHLDELIEGARIGRMTQFRKVLDLEIRLKAVESTPFRSFEELHKLSDLITAGEDFIPQTFRELKINAFKVSIIDLEYFHNWLIDERDNFLKFIDTENFAQTKKSIPLSPKLLKYLEKEGFINCANRNPIKWLKNKQLLRELMTNKIVRRDLTIADVERLIPQNFIDKKNNPLSLAKNKTIASTDRDKLLKFLATL
jgi:hypothetical protein